MYINVDGLGRQRAEEMVAEYTRHFLLSPNINCWVLPVKQQQETRLEIIWKGSAIEAGQPGVERGNQAYQNNLQNVMSTFNNITNRARPNQNNRLNLNDFDNRDNDVLIQARRRRENERINGNDPRPGLEPERLTNFERNELQAHDNRLQASLDRLLEEIEEI